MSIEVTVRDTENGHTETATIDDDYILIVAGTCWLDGYQDYPAKGTRVLTIKGRGGRGIVAAAHPELDPAERTPGGGA